ncbi:hypothetical protein [Methylobacterium radiodurans]|nr:hypothetical protein [Methylobacterium radiodurans]
MGATSGDRHDAQRIGRQFLDLAMLVAGGIGLALPLIWPLG